MNFCWIRSASTIASRSQGCRNSASPGPTGEILDRVTPETVEPQADTVKPAADAALMATHIEQIRQVVREEVGREAAALHAKVDRLNVTPLVMQRHAWVKHILHDFEYNPKTQYKVHLVAMWVWTFSMITVVGLFTFANHFWQVVSVLYLVLISLYANWATDYGAMSAALAAMNEAPMPEVPLEQHVDPPAEVT